MLLFRSSEASVLIGFLLIAQGLCKTLPLPEQKSRTVRDTADIPTELFKPVGKNPSNRANSTVAQYSASEESESPVRFFERSDGNVEVVTAEYEEEEEEENDQPLYRQSSRRTSRFPIPAPRFESNFQTDPREVPRFARPESSLSRPPFPSSSSWISRPIPIPIAPNNFRMQSSGSGPNGPIGSSNNFYRSESYSYTSDGRGPPQIEQNVYDSRNGLGGTSFRNF